MSAVSSSGAPSQRSLELVFERIGLLVEAEAIFVLAILPASVLGASVPVATYGVFPAPIIPLDWSRLFADAAFPSTAITLPSALAGKHFGVPDTRLCLAAPVFDQDSRNVSGTVIAIFPRDDGGIVRRQAAMEVLVQLATHEFTQSRALEELTGALAHAKALSRRHLEAGEHERRSLAAGIHDDLSQNVTLMRLGLSSLQRELDGGRLERALVETKELMRVSREIAESVQRVAVALRPAMIGTFGPAQAIGEESAQHERVTGVPVTCELTDISAPACVSLALFRIVQGSLSNIERHSRATRVRIRLKKQRHSLVLSVEDNGRGFEVDRFRSSLGLLAMTEQAEIAGGTLSIKSSPGEGTRVVAAFPEVSKGGE